MVPAGWVPGRDRDSTTGTKALDPTCWVGTCHLAITSPVLIGDPRQSDPGLQCRLGRFHRLISWKPVFRSENNASAVLGNRSPPAAWMCPPSGRKNRIAGNISTGTTLAKRCWYRALSAVYAWKLHWLSALPGHHESENIAAVALIAGIHPGTKQFVLGRCLGWSTRCHKRYWIRYQWAGLDRSGPAVGWGCDSRWALMARIDHHRYCCD